VSILILPRINEEDEEEVNSDYLEVIGKKKLYDNGAIAQLGEHLLCTQGVVGSIPSGSTKSAKSLQR
jgi:hypothetical protein